jgi:hypothetical protein
MSAPKQESKFIRLVMNGASEDEIAEATRIWFAYLQILDTIISDAERDSHQAKAYVRFNGDRHSDV